MNNTQKIGVGAVAILAIIFGVAFLKPAVVQVNLPQQTPSQQSYSSIPGDVLESRQFNINGVRNEYNRISYYQATSTLCVVPPPQATSTLVRFTGKNTSATSTTVLYVLEKRSNAFAPILSAATTSNVLASALLAANDDGMFSYTATSTSYVSGDGNNDLGEITPSQYLVFYAKNGGGGSIAQTFGSGSIFTGNCNSVMLRE